MCIVSISSVFEPFPNSCHLLERPSLSLGPRETNESVCSPRTCEEEAHEKGQAPFGVFKCMMNSSSARTVTRTGSGRSAVGSASIESGPFHSTLPTSNKPWKTPKWNSKWQQPSTFLLVGWSKDPSTTCCTLHYGVWRLWIGFAFHPHGKAWASGHAAPRRGPGLGLSESTWAQWMMISKGLVQKKGDIYIYIHFVY